MLSTDLLQHIAMLGGCETAIKLGMVSKYIRAAIEEGIALPFQMRDKLINIHSTSLMCDLQASLYMSAAKVKTVPYTKKHRYPGGKYNIFVHDSAVQLFHKYGGMDGFEKRINRKRMRSGRTDRERC